MVTNVQLANTLPWNQPLLLLTEVVPWVKEYGQNAMKFKTNQVFQQKSGKYLNYKAKLHMSFESFNIFNQNKYKCCIKTAVTLPWV